MNNSGVELITVDELCELLQCGYSTAYKLLSDKTIPSFEMLEMAFLPY
jgi:predicted DNA-binding transcriptional regulator AlpA